ncbi:MAG: LamG domain-containing protein [Deltaproteobacteria bacterium]|nr:LamG domain-containing protein [Deltaproteobacteria bacterium]
MPWESGGDGGGDTAIWGGITGALSNQTDLDTRLKVTEEQYVYFEIFDSKTTSTGTVSVPTESTILFDRYANGIDAICVVLDSNGRPLDESAREAGGTIVTVSTFDSSGNYTLSGTPSPVPFGIVYQIKIQLQYSNNVPEASVIIAWQYEGVEIENNTAHIYLNGNGSIDGSRRFAVNSDTGYATIEKLIDGLWQPATLQTGPNSLFVGINVGIAAAGHHILTEDSDGHFHFHAHAKFDGELSTSDARIIDAYTYTAREVQQPDNTGTFTGTSMDFIVPAAQHSLLAAVHLQTDTVGATAPVRYRGWQGSDDTGILIFDQYYPASKFHATIISTSGLLVVGKRYVIDTYVAGDDFINVGAPSNTTGVDFTATGTTPTTWTNGSTLSQSEITLEADGYLETLLGLNYYTRIESTANFSIKMEATNSFPWLAVDVSAVHEDDMLQTTEWLTGDTFTEDQWTIQNRKIYKCNTTGVQNGTFASNIALWDDITEIDAFWTRTGIILSPKTSGDTVAINGLLDLARVDGTALINFGSGGSDTIAFNDSYSGSKSAWVWTQDNNDYMILLDGNLGIGTNDPDSLLHVQGNVSGDSEVHFHNASNTTTTINSLVLTNGSNSDQATKVRTFGQLFTTAGAYVQDGGAVETGSGLGGGLSVIANSGNVRLYAGGNTDLDKQMEIEATGVTVEKDLTVDTTTLKVDSTNKRVGVGTSTPSVELDVVGDINASGSVYQPTYGDTENQIWNIPFNLHGSAITQKGRDQYGLSLITHGTPITGATTGAFGSGVDFNGSDASYSAPMANAPSGAEPWTFELWIKTDSLSQSNIWVYFLGSNVTDRGYLLSINNTDLIIGAYGNTDTIAGAIASTSLWYQIQTSYDGTDLKSYLNGALVATKTVTLNILANNMLFAEDLSSNFYDGKVSNFKLYDRALSEQELRTHYLRDSQGSMIKGNSVKIVDLQNNTNLEVLRNSNDAELHLNTPASGGSTKLFFNDESGVNKAELEYRDDTGNFEIVAVNNALFRGATGATFTGGSGEANLNGLNVKIESSGGTIDLETTSADIILNPTGIAGTTGVLFPTLTASQALYLDSNKRATNTAPTSLTTQATYTLNDGTNDRFGYDATKTFLQDELSVNPARLVLANGTIGFTDGVNSRFDITPSNTQLRSPDVSNSLAVTNDAVTSTKEIITDESIAIKEITTPTAVSGYGRIYTKTDNELYFQTGGGAELVITKEFGCMYVSTPAETTITTINTPVLMSGTTTEVTSSDHVAVSSAGRITYTGAKTRCFKVDAAVTMTTAGNNKLVSFYIARNGTPLTPSRQQRFVSTGADVGNMALTCMPQLATNDYIEIYVENNTDNTNVTGEFMNANIMSID